MFFNRGVSCGVAKKGVEVSGYDRAGGVMTIEQMTTLKDLLELGIKDAMNELR
jgi:hypothetical protein